MTVVALTNFLTLSNPRRNKGRYQNSEVGKTIELNNDKYKYLAFIYQGATKNRTGDNLEAALILSANEISIGIAIQALKEKWNVRVDSCSMDPEKFTVAKILTTEYWIVASVRYDANVVEILLSSSVDAVGALAPSRVLTRDMVGALPSTGQLTNR